MDFNLTFLCWLIDRDQDIQINICTTKSKQTRTTVYPFRSPQRIFVDIIPASKSPQTTSVVTSTIKTCTILVCIPAYGYLLLPPSLVKKICREREWGQMSQFSLVDLGSKACWAASCSRNSSALYAHSYVQSKTSS
jgi:hypothetical protein